MSLRSEQEQRERERGREREGEKERESKRESKRKGEREREGGRERERETDFLWSSSVFASPYLLRDLFSMKMDISFLSFSASLRSLPLPFSLDESISVEVGERASPSLL